MNIEPDTVGWVRLAVAINWSDDPNQNVPPPPRTRLLVIWRSLDDSQRALLTLLYGLHGSEPLSSKDAAKALKKTRTDVHWLRNETIKQMRRALTYLNASHPDAAA